MSKEIKIPAVTVAYKVQGVSGEIEIAKLPAETVEYILTYGARRLVQDAVNSKAKTLRDANESVDAKALVAERIAQLESAEFGRKGTAESFTDFDNAVYDMAVTIKGESGWSELAAVWATSKGLTTAERKRAVLDTVESLDDKRKKAIETAAQNAIDARAALAGLDI